MTKALIERSAVISPCGLFRYRLSRTWDATLPRVVFLMMNPSTADGTVDDATIRKCIGFAKTWNYGGFDVINLFAFRSRNPDDLLYATDPVGPEYDSHFIDILCNTKQVVAAWGCDSTLKKQERLRVRPEYLIGLIRARFPHVNISCLGNTKHGSPKHPLMLGYSTPLGPFTAGQPGGIVC